MKKRVMSIIAVLMMTVLIAIPLKAEEISSSEISIGNNVETTDVSQNDEPANLDEGDSDIGQDESTSESSVEINSSDEKIIQDNFQEQSDADEESVDNEVREAERVSLNGEWIFTKEGEATVVNVPHCWEYVHPTMSYIPAKNAITASYEKTIDVSGYNGKNVFIKFYGVNKKATLYVDGAEVGTHTGGFTAFTFDITQYINNDTVNLRLDVLNIDTVTTPINVDFTHWAGIYRDVELIICDDYYFSQEDLGSEGIYVDSNISGGSADLSIKTKVSSKNIEKNLIIKNELYDADGNLIADNSSDITVRANESNQEFSSVLNVQNPRLWNGTNDPYLYELKSYLLSEDGKAYDTRSTKIGIREVEVNNGKFYLNGNEYKLKGVGFHQERGWIGNATTDEMKKSDINTVLEIGANAIRTAHYPHSQLTYNLADENGLIVWNEIPFYLLMADTDEFRTSTKTMLQEMIRQGYNHPSISFWGIQNEVQSNSQYAAFGPQFNVDLATLSDYIKELASTAKSEDSSRIVSQALYNGDTLIAQASNWTDPNLIDMSGVNKYTGWYSNVAKTDDSGRKQIYDELNTELDQYKSILNVDTIAITEYGGGANTEQHETLGENFSWNGWPMNNQPFHPEEYQAYVHEAYYNALQARDDIPVAFVWSLFDFTCYRNEGGQLRTNDKGLVTSDRSTKKDAFYFYKANWNENDKFTYITSRRYTERNSDFKQIKVYSNCDSVNVYLNGTDLGKGRKQQDGVFVWDNVKFEENNSIKAVGDGFYEDYVDGIKVDTSEYNISLGDIYTAETKTNIKLKVDYTSNDPDVSFTWKYLDLKTKSWYTMDAAGNEVAWKPKAGIYLIYVEARTKDNKVDSRSMGYEAKIDFSKLPDISLDGMTWIVHEDSIDVGTAYTDPDNNAEFRWQAYDLDKQEWSEISDWNSGNWANWKPKKGNYWLHVSMRNSKNQEISDTICFNVGKDYGDKQPELKGMTWVIRNNCIDVGTDYSSGGKKVEFRWQAYNLDSKEWSDISDWDSGNWTSWKPNKGNYWLHVSMRDEDGVEQSNTICFRVDKDYMKETFELKGMTWIFRNDGIDVGTDYISDYNNTMFKWEAYNLKTKEWFKISDWSNGNWATWKPKKGDYWLHVTMKNENGKEVSNTICFRVSKSYL